MSSIPSVSYQGVNPSLNLIQQKAVSKPDEVKNESQQVAFQGAESSKKMSKGAKIALAGLGALGTIGLAIYAIKKGKAPKDIVKELSIDDFRQAGNKLVKGKAYKPDGSAFSGAFTSMKKDGSKVVMTYENGILKSSEILKPLKGKFIPSSKKVYEHGADGKISKISKKIWGHVNTPDPKTHGFQWIEKDVVDMNKARKEGRMKLWQKNTADIKNKFERKSEMTADKWYCDLVDPQKGCRADMTFGVGKPADYDYKTYVFELAHEDAIAQKLAKKRQERVENGQKLVKTLEEKLNGKQTSATIEREFFTPNEEGKRLSAYYKSLEQAEVQNKENVQKLKAHLRKKSEIHAAEEPLDLVRPELKQLKESMLNGEGVKSELNKFKQKEAELVGEIFEELDGRFDYEKLQSDEVRSEIISKISKAWSLTGQNFRAVNKYVDTADGPVHIIFEGATVDIASDGSILQKLLVNYDVKQPNNVTDEIITRLRKSSADRKLSARMEEVRRHMESLRKQNSGQIEMVERQMESLCS